MTDQLSTGALRPPAPSWLDATRATLLTAVGFVLTGVTYGLVRMSLGQFLPEIRAELGLSETWAGLLSSGLFAGNCIALLFAAILTHAWGPRITASLAGVLATTGLVAMVIAETPLVFGVGMLVAGSAAGLTIPPLVAAIQCAVRAGRRALAITIINAGTSAGLIASAPLAFAAEGDWRVTYALFAIIAGVVTLATLLATPGRRRHLEMSEEAQDGLFVESMTVLEAFWKRSQLRVLFASAFLCGFVITSFWTFGGEALSQLGGWTGGQIGFFWIVLGVAGLLGAPAGAVMRHFGTQAVHRVSFMALTLSIFCLIYAGLSPAVAVLGAVLQGVAYMTISGVYLVWGVDEMPENPSAVVAAEFFLLPAGLVAGSCVFGYGLAHFGMMPTLVAFGCLSAMGVLLKVSSKPLLSSVAPTGPMRDYA
ncbi:MAG: MFS transporter [Pseudomonadota bacterium]